MAVVRNPLETFVWGKGGAALTPEEIAQQREVEQALLAKNGIDTSPVGHWTQGIARVLGAAGGAYRRNKLEAAGAENADYNTSIINSLIGGGASASPVASIPMSGAAGEIASSSPAQSIDMSGNEVYSTFMDTVGQQVKNPYALAAIASTGKAESGFSPGNVNRTWSDPSQSGQPGTAGGIMSWRGPRYQALAATGDLSPVGQAKFFLQEDPNLIAALNKAGSVEEAQRLMNNAWQFAGFDQPGGEAGRRLQVAQSFLPTFQAGGEVAAATPQAAIEAIAPTTGGSLSDEVSAFRQTPEYAAQFPGQQMDIVSKPQPSPVVQQIAQAAPAQTGINPAILRALSDPRSTPQTRAVAQALMQQDAARQQAAQEQQTWMQRQQYEQDQKRNDPAYQIGLEKSRLEVDNLRNPPLTPADKLAREKFDYEKGQQGKTADINEYEYAKERGYDGSFVQFQLDQKKAGASSTTINNGEGDKFYENLDKKNAESFAALSEAGVGGRSRLGQLNQLEALLSQAQTGGGANLKLWLGDMGINTEGLDELQATRAFVEKLVPEQRAPGSGPMSDADIAMYRRSLPSVINQPGGNSLILGTAKAIAQYDVQMGEIADQVADRVITPAEGRKRIRELENPLDGYSKMMRELGPAAGGSNAAKPISEMSDEELRAIIDGR